MLGWSRGRSGCCWGGKVCEGSLTLTLARTPPAELSARDGSRRMSVGGKGRGRVTNIKTQRVGKRRMKEESSSSHRRQRSFDQAWEPEGNRKKERERERRREAQMREKDQ